MFKKIDLVFLAGGKGTRIKKYLNGDPKPLVKINNISFIEILLRYYSKYITGDIYILAGYRGWKIKKKYNNKYFNFCKVKVIVEKKLLGTGGALFNLKRKIKNDFVLINADTFFPINLQKFVNLSNKKKLVNIALTNKKYYSSNKKLINLQLKNKIISNSNKNTKYMNGGIYFIKKKLLKINKQKVFSWENYLNNNLINNNQVGGLFFSNIFIDIGTPNKLKLSGKTLNNFFFKPAIILDRDNTINIDKGYTYKKKDLRFKPKILKYLKYLSNKDYFKFIVTNQAGIAKGLFKIQDFINFQQFLKKKLIKKNIFIDDVMFCPYHPNAKIKKYKKNSDFRKPGILMIKQLEKFWKFNKSKSLVVGDSVLDEKMAKRSSIRFLYIDKLLKKI